MWSWDAEHRYIVPAVPPDSGTSFVHARFKGFKAVEAMLQEAAIACRTGADPEELIDMAYSTLNYLTSINETKLRAAEGKQ